eukprot:scpid101290/ scgid4378/ 
MNNNIVTLRLVPVAGGVGQHNNNNGILAGQAVPNAAGNDVNRVGPAGQPALLALPPALPAALAPALAPAAPFAPLAMQVSPRQPLPAHHASTHHPSTRCAECDLFMYSARYINQHVTHLCPALGRSRSMVIECTA